VHTGQGVEGRIDGRPLWIGRPDFVAARTAIPRPVQSADFASRGGTVIALAEPGVWLGLFRLADVPRPEAAILTAKLARERRRMTVLSGDAPQAVESVSGVLGIADAHGGLTPQDKQSFIATLQQRPDAVVAMIGDGVNDAPVLAQAHVSIAMGGGTELARNQADVVLLSENLAGLGRGIDRSRRTLRVIKQNLWWSFAYNFTSVPLAMAGLVTPWMAGIGMAASSLLVVLNALRLQRLPHSG
jgi:Cu2+-exporting ATPase